MKKIILIIFSIFLFWCQNTEKIEEKTETLENIEKQENSIIIWKNTENLVDFEEKISLKEIHNKIYVDFVDWEIKIKNFWEENFLKNLKIQKVEKFPWNIEINLTKKQTCKENEIDTSSFCIDKIFYENLLKKYEDNSWMWGFEKRTCFWEVEFCDEKNYDYKSNFWFLWNELIHNNFEKKFYISFKNFKNFLIIDFYENEKYLTSEVFFTNDGKWKSLLWNLENKNVLRIFETLNFPSENDFIIDFSSDKNFLKKEKTKISFEDFGKLDFKVEWGKNIIYLKNFHGWPNFIKWKNFLRSLKIEEVEKFPHNLYVDFTRNPNCKNDEKLSKNFYCYKIWKKPIVAWEEIWIEVPDFYNENIYSSVDFFSWNWNYVETFDYISEFPKNLEIFLKKYKNYLIVDFYDKEKYLKSLVIYFHKDDNWYPKKFFLNLNLESHRRFLESYYIPEN